MEVLGHLAESAKRVADQSDEQRVAYIHRDQFIRSEQVTAALSQIEYIYRYPRQTRMPCLLIIGPTGIGKTKLVEAFCRGHPRQDRVLSTGSELIQPVVSIQMPPEPSQNAIFTYILHAMNSPDHCGTGLALEKVTYRVLEALGVRLIFLDEFHNLNCATARQRQIAINALKNLTNATRIPLVAVGTEAASIAIRYDDQMSHRFRPIELRPFKGGPSFAAFVRTYVMHLPLRLPSEFESKEFHRQLLGQTNGITVSILRTLGEAAVSAIRTGREKIDLSSLQEGPAPLVAMQLETSTAD